MTDKTMNNDNELRGLQERVQLLESLLLGWCDHGWSREREAQSREACYAGPSDLDVATHMAKAILHVIR